MNYDIAINNWLNEEDKETVGVCYNKVANLKYGLNPHMTPSHIYVKNRDLVPFQILNGEAGYINLLDVNYAIHLVCEVRKELGVTVVRVINIIHQQVLPLILNLQNFIGLYIIKKDLKSPKPQDYFWRHVI